MEGEGGIVRVSKDISVLVYSVFLFKNVTNVCFTPVSPAQNKVTLEILTD